MTARIPALAVLALLTALPSAAAAPAQRARSDQEILMQLERDWDEAHRSRDVAFVERLLADEFIATYDDGTRGNKAQELDRTARFDRQIVSSTLDEFTVRVYGDTAIVWVTHRLVGPSKGQRLELTFRYMDIFVMRDGRWQCVASQTTRVSAAPSPPA